MRQVFRLRRVGDIFRVDAIVVTLLSSLKFREVKFAVSSCEVCSLLDCQEVFMYRTRVIIPRGLHIFYSIFHCGL